MEYTEIMEDILPILGSLDERPEYKEKIDLLDYYGKKVCNLAQVPEIVFYTDKIKKRVENGKKTLEGYKIKELAKITEKAGKKFRKKVGDVEWEDYVRNITLLSGVPIKYVERGCGLLSYGMRKMRRILKSQTAERDLKLYDGTIEKRDNRNYIRVKKGETLGINLPGNNSAVNILPLEAIVLLKGEAFIRPSSEEPLTPERIISSLYECGFPEDTLYFCPCSHRALEEIIDLCDLMMMFGGEEIKKMYGNNENVKIYGPGNSKIFGRKEVLLDNYEEIKNAVLADGGRGCINVSQIIVDGNQNDAREVAEYLAEDFAKIEFVDPLEKDAIIPAVKKETGEKINSFIQDNLTGTAEDLSSKYKERFGEEEGIYYLNPTVIFIEKNAEDHPLFTELPFQYVVVAPFEKNEKIFEDTLTLSIFTNEKEEKELLKEFMRIKNISKIYVNKLPTDISLEEPHEGLLGDFLYKVVTYRE